MKTNRFNRSRMTLLAVALIVSLTLGGLPANQVQAEAPQGLFTDAGNNIPAVVRPANASVARSRYLYVNQAMLFDGSGQPLNNNSLPEVALNIFPDVAYTGMITGLEVNQWGTSWTGNIKGNDGYFYMVISDGAFIAHIASSEGVYEISSAGDNLYQAIQIDQSVFVDHDPAATFDPPSDIIPEGDLGPTADSANSIDVMVVYTQAARAAEGSTAAMKARIALAVTETNTSYTNAGVTTRLNLVYTKEYADAESSNLDTNLNRLVSSTDSYFVGVQAMRDTYGADMVGLIVENGGGYCGLANAIMANASNAYNVTARSCATGYYSFGHEFGHLQGARHDVFVDPSTTPFAYGHGYVHPGDLWRTVMAYGNACGNCTRLQWWSNPSKTYSGAAMGNETAKNYQVLNTTAYTVANFRLHKENSLIPTPKTPSGTITDRTPTYIWSKIAGATSYRYQLYKGTSATPFYTKTVTTPVCGATTCSNTPTNILAFAAYKWRVQAKVGGVWKPYSVYKTFTVKAPLVIPTPKTPSGTITDTTPTYIWSKIAGATSYRYQLYKGTSATPFYTKTVTTPVCGATTCSNTPTNILAFAAYKWRVQAKVGGVWKPYSVYKNFTVAKPAAGFNSDFNGTKTGWSNVTGTWNILSSKYLHSTGVNNVFSSTTHTGNFANFTYSVRMKRTGYGLSASNIVIRGKPSVLDSFKEWLPSYMFEYTNSGSFAVFKIDSTGIITELKPWTSHAAIVMDGWNTLKVVAVGSSLKYYINNTLVWSGSDSSLSTGQVGIEFYRDTTPGTLDVDWATLTITNADSNLAEEVVPGVELSGGTIYQSP